MSFWAYLSRPYTFFSPHLNTIRPHNPGSSPSAKIFLKTAWATQYIVSCNIPRYRDENSLVRILSFESPSLSSQGPRFFRLLQFLYVSNPISTIVSQLLHECGSPHPSKYGINNSSCRKLRDAAWNCSLSLHQNYHTKAPCFSKVYCSPLCIWWFSIPDILKDTSLEIVEQWQQVVWEWWRSIDDPSSMFG